jgi:hypothetical protein
MCFLAVHLPRSQFQSVPLLFAASFAKRRECGKWDSKLLAGQGCSVLDRVSIRWNSSSAKAPQAISQQPQKQVSPALPAIEDPVLRERVFTDGSFVNHPAKSGYENNNRTLAVCSIYRVFLGFWVLTVWIFSLRSLAMQF